MTVPVGSQREEPRQGHVDRESGQKCGWANGAHGCLVPQCRFPEERCIIVKRQRARAAG